MLSPLERYKNTIRFIQSNFKEKIDIPTIEKISLYSYRNINRIFLSLHHETIGKYIKRIRLEKAAEYIKYTVHPISEIALDVGFSDIAAFSKAFKNKFGYSPSTFRETSEKIIQQNSEIILSKPSVTAPEYHIEILPQFNMLYLEHRGDYKDFEAINNAWDTLWTYCNQKKLLSHDTIFFSETLDDNEISDHLTARTNLAIVLEKEINFPLDGLFQIKEHERQKYAKFMHKGTPQTLENTYIQIFAYWLSEIPLELADKPILEFYVNHELPIPAEQFITEIYIPIE